MHVRSRRLALAVYLVALSRAPQDPVVDGGARRRPCGRAGHVRALLRVRLDESAGGVEQEAREQRMHTGRQRVLVVEDRVQVQVRHEARVELMREPLRCVEITV